MKRVNFTTIRIPSGSFLSLLILSVMLTTSYAFSSSDDTVKKPPIVSCSWLAENITGSGVVVLHVAGIRLDYDNGHIPGAGFLWPGDVSVSTRKESSVPAQINDLTKILNSLGVRMDSHIILCGVNGNIIQVCRVFVVLDHIGFRGRVSILDGGFDEWKTSGGQISGAGPVIKKGKISPHLRENLVDAEWMMKNLENTTYRIIDARAKALYDGSTGIPRQGHIPGAKNLTATDLFDNKTFCFLPVEKLKENFDRMEIGPGVRPVFYCHVGNMASVDYVAATILGYEPLLYDGSMEEWGSRSDLPIEKN